MEELNLDRTDLSWLEESTILVAPVGSYAYGTNIETSDRDYKGICIPPISYYLGLNSFNEYNKVGGKNFKNTSEDIDVIITHISKFVKDAMNGVPNNIEMLFIEPEKYLKITPIGQELIDNRHLFLTKQIKNKFGGFAYSQIQKLKHTNRKELIGEHGYDTKNLMHSMRLLLGAIQILETHDFTTYSPHREFLKDCRLGKYSFKEAVEMVESYDSQLQTALEKSTLPKKPNYKAINKLLINLNKKGLDL